MRSFKRPLPFILIADTSSSMKEHGKIASLNTAIKEMIQRLQLMQQDEEVQFLITIVGFERGSIKEFFHAVNVQEIEWADLNASGVTPLGDAFLKVADLLGQEDVVPKNSYAPILLLVSDGQPTDAKGHFSDGWRESLKLLKAAPRGDRGMAFAMAIGPDADEDMLSAFSSNGKVFFANDGEKICQFFQLVTLATSVSLGKDPIGAVSAQDQQETILDKSLLKQSIKTKTTFSSLKQEKSVSIVLDDEPKI